MCEKRDRCGWSIWGRKNEESTVHVFFFHFGKARTHSSLLFFVIFFSWSYFFRKFTCISLNIQNCFSSKWKSPSMCRMYIGSVFYMFWNFVSHCFRGQGAKIKCEFLSLFCDVAVNIFCFWNTRGVFSFLKYSFILVLDHRQSTATAIAHITTLNAMNNNFFLWTHLQSSITPIFHWPVYTHAQAVCVYTFYT